jgi:adenosylcobinamide kinase/adenosylcobinamide-phosphate guanylyltransferase
MICFVSGGVRSGKSTFAEKYAHHYQVDRKIYIATSIPYDDEMKSRVKNHRDHRKMDGWITFEKPMKLDQVISELKDEDVVLIDCLTIWLSNEMFEEQTDEERIIELSNDIIDGMIQTIITIENKVKALVIVSNDVFENADTLYGITEQYVRNLGILHQRLAEIADEVYESVAGIQVRRK